MTKIKRKCFFERKRLKQALILVGILIITLAFSGCEKLVETDVSAETKSTIQTVSETTVSANQERETQYVTGTKQSHELTFDDINIIEINGQQVSLPFKIDELGENYSIGEEYGYDETYPTLCYKNQSLALIKLDNEKNIISISFYIDDWISNTVKIYGISYNNSFPQIIESIGTPTKQKEFALIYEYNNGKLYLGSENGSLGLNFMKISIYGGTKNE
ncbi:MAG: hypothetical protein OSJ54_00205 [Oscillospiraceae bacterium]|nr:hypothetical protein [Oscillospiraceae bacterium]